MTVEQFWYDDPELFFNYKRVYEQKQKTEQQLIWAIGVRVQQALSTTPIVAGLANNSIISNMPKFPDCPFVDEVSDEEMSQAEIDRLQEEEAKELMAWVNSFNK